jgi:hypothetical protein
MVLRGEQIQRCGLGGCQHLTSHTLFKRIAELYQTCACTPAWSAPRRACLSFIARTAFMSLDRDIVRRADRGHQ